MEQDRPSTKDKKIIRTLNVIVEFFDDGNLQFAMKNNPPVGKEILEKLANKNEQVQINDELVSIMLIDNIKKAMEATFVSIATAEKKSLQTDTEDLSEPTKEG